MKRAFTLIELIVVIGIIAILAATLVVSFGGGTESARSARCLSNMKNLANACQTYGMSAGDHIYPRAWPNESKAVSIGNGTPKISYIEQKGWISWDSEGKYPGGSAASHQTCSVIGFAVEDAKKSQFALTNSCIWQIVAQNRETFVCPDHVKQRGKKRPPTWSYLMNEKFKWQKFGELNRADRYLLFSEIPFKTWHSWCPEGTGTDTDDNAVLEYPNGKSGKNETIGCNHFAGKELVAHIAFADGHVEKLRIPNTGSKKKPVVDESELKNLTEWLCTGEDISFTGKKYHKMEN